MELGCDDPEMIDNDDSDPKVCGQVLQQPNIGIESTG